jgi:hypothetical protein
MPSEVEVGQDFHFTQQLAEHFSPKLGLSFVINPRIIGLFFIVPNIILTPKALRQSHCIVEYLATPTINGQRYTQDPRDYIALCIDVDVLR